jgi:tetratricopeptide (TPR) repeat protein
MGLYGEPLGVLHPDDLVALARTLKRAGAAERALCAADRAIAAGARAEGLRVRGLIEKARGDRLRALADFEAASAELDDPAVRLELAKLYEHHARRPLQALAMVRQGTSESPDKSWRRQLRLERKVLREARSGK